MDKREGDERSRNPRHRLRDPRRTAPALVVFDHVGMSEADAQVPAGGVQSGENLAGPHRPALRFHAVGATLSVTSVHRTASCGRLAVGRAQRSAT